jgi:hypothetical protein
VAAAGGAGSGVGAPSAATARVARSLRLIVGEWRWPVVPGVQLSRSGKCSCGEDDCRQPGAHPVDAASWLAASADPDRVREWWLAAPLAAIVLPVGWHVDVIDAPESGGREALGRLEMMGYRPAPAISTAGGRLLFLVAAGARRTADFAERGRGRSRVRKRSAVAGSALPTQPGPETGLWLGGDSSGAPDIVVRRRGVLVLPPIGPEPPGVTRWLVEPDAVRRPLPRAEDVLGPIVHACRDVAARQHRRSGQLAGAAIGRGRALELNDDPALSRPPAPAAPPVPAVPTASAVPAMPAVPTAPAAPPIPAVPTASAVPAMPAVPAASAVPAIPAAAAVVSAVPGRDRPQAAAEPRAPGARTVNRRGGGTRSAGRPAAGTAGRRSADERRVDAASAAWKERLRRVRPEPPPAPA